MDTKTIKPSKKMMEALENEGLYITWPDDVRDECPDATYYTSNGKFEKLVYIDFRDPKSLRLETEHEVDIAVAEQLDAAWRGYSVEEEMELLMAIPTKDRIARRIPAVRDLIEDLEEAERKLSRFAEVACAVVNDTPIPERDDDAEKTIKLSLKDCKKIVSVLNDYSAGCPCDNRCEELRLMLDAKMPLDD